MKGRHAQSLNAPPEAPSFRQEMQEKDGTFGVVARPNGVPMKANPVHNCEPGLGAKTIAHPYKKSKPHI